MTWRPTPKSQLIMARKLVASSNGAESWVDIEMKDLKPGDIFRAVGTNGELIHHGSQEPDENCVALCTDYPIKNINNEIGSILGEQGYGVPMVFYESMDELRRKGLS